MNLKCSQCGLPAEIRVSSFALGGTTFHRCAAHNPLRESEGKNYDNFFYFHKGIAELGGYGVEDIRKEVIKK